MLRRLPGSKVPVQRVAVRRALTKVDAPLTCALALCSGVIHGVAVDGAAAASLRLCTSQRTGNTINKTVLRAQFTGGKAPSPGDVMMIIGLLAYRPIFNGVSLTYDYTHEIVVNTQIGLAIQAMRERQPRVA
jgi:hypothetical protein